MAVSVLRKKGDTGTLMGGRAFAKRTRGRSSGLLSQARDRDRSWKKPSNDGRYEPDRCGLTALLKQLKGGRKGIYPVQR